MGIIQDFVQNPGNTAICYYRYSSDAQRDVSIDQQREAAYGYAKAHNLEIIKEYEDAAVSGMVKDRDGYQQMMYEAKTLRPAYLILWKTDRLSRRREHATAAKAELRAYGVKIIYVAEAIPDDDDDGISGLIETILEGMAEQYIYALRKNVKRGMNYNAERSIYNGIRILGYKGETDQPYTIDPDAAPIVRRIYEEYASGTPMQQICNKLNEQGLKSVNGNDFTINSLRKILSNKAYIGVYKWGKHTNPGAMPRLIEDDLFQRVQARMEANKRGGKAAIKQNDPQSEITDFWLSNHIYCGLCGGTMQGISGSSHTGQRHHYYSCKNHRKHQCTMHNKKQELLETIVLHILEEVTHDPAHRLIIAQKCFAYYQREHSDGGAFEKSMKAQLRDTEKKIANILKAIEAGVITETTTERLKELENTRAHLREALLAEQNRKQYEIKLEDIVKYLEQFDGDLSDTTKRKKILEQYIERIIVTEDTITVVFYYTGERREIPMADMMAQLENKQRISDMLNGEDASFFQ